MFTHQKNNTPSSHTCSAALYTGITPSASAAAALEGACKTSSSMTMVSTGHLIPSATHAGYPPLSTATSACPMTRNVHHTRGALNIPARSYTMTVSLLVIPKASHAAANARGVGSMCGSAMLWSAMASRSKNLLPGIRWALNSATGSLPGLLDCRNIVESKREQVITSSTLSSTTPPHQPHHPSYLPAVGRYHVASNTLTLSRLSRSHSTLTIGWPCNIVFAAAATAHSLAL